MLPFFLNNNSCAKLGVVKVTNRGLEFTDTDLGAASAATIAIQPTGIGIILTSVRFVSKTNPSKFERTARLRSRSLRWCD